MSGWSAARPPRSANSIRRSPPQGVAVPNGFAITADAYRDALSQPGVAEELHRLLDGLDKRKIKQLAAAAAKARAVIYKAMDTAPIRDQIVEAYRQLEREAGKGVAVAVRSSATAEDLPTASFAGQHESFLNVRGAKDLFEACRRCFASIFTDRAISYRIDNGFDHFKVFLSVAVMKMVRSDIGASGVIFTLDTESGFRDVVFVTGCYGLGETIVQGQVDPDEFYVHKPTLAQGFRRVLRRRLGGKQIRMIYGKRGGSHATLTRNVPEAERRKFCISDAEVLNLADFAVRIEAHYSKHAGRPMPMDIEWAKDGADGKLYIIQARPETVASQRSAECLRNLRAEGARRRRRHRPRGRRKDRRRPHAPHCERAGPLDLQAGRDPGRAGDQSGLGAGHEDRGRHHHRQGRPHLPCRHRGARARHSRRGRRDARDREAQDRDQCHDLLRRRRHRQRLSGHGGLRRHANARQRAQGAAHADHGQCRHPRNGVPDRDAAAITASASPAWSSSSASISACTRWRCSSRTRSPRPRRGPRSPVWSQGYKTPADFFIERLSEGVGTIAAAFYPKPVIVRLSDFKTNEYASLLGGEAFEPKEENPMLGFRGASRYSHPAYAEGFALECAALRRVREEMGLSNLRIMVPFCRTVEEGKRVIATMAANGLKRGENGLEIYVMCEIPEQRHPDRRVRAIVRRLLDRLQRSHPADAGGRPRFRYRRLRFRRTRSRHAGDVQAGGDGRQAQRAARRHLRRSAGELSGDRALPDAARHRFDQRQSIERVSHHGGGASRPKRVRRRPQIAHCGTVMVDRASLPGPPG